MESSFSTNPYYLLGLSSSASQSDIKKQSRLITARLSIGESILDSDFAYLKTIRTEDAINNAVQHLSNLPKKVKYVYFWFSDENYEELVKIISEQPLDEVYTYLSKRAEKVGKWNDKRNLALFLVQLLQYKKIYKEYLMESLELWKSLIESEGSWKFFELYYANIDDMKTDESVFSDLRAYVNQEVSDIYSELTKRWNDKDYVRSYSKLFNTMGSVTEKEVYEPCANKIDEVIKKLNSIKWTQDGPSKENLNDVKKAIKDIQESINLLIENGIFEDSRSVVLRDKAAESIRGVGIKLYNDYLDYEKSSGVMEIADKIAGTTALKSQLGEDKFTAKKTIATEGLTLPILELAKEKKWMEALEMIDKLMKKNASNSETTNTLKEHKREIIRRYALEQRNDALDKISVGKPRVCKQELIELQDYLLKEMDLFAINKAWIDSTEKTIRENTGRINRAQVTVLDNYRAKKVAECQKAFGETPEAAVSIALLDTYLYIPMCDFIQKVRSRNQTVSVLKTIGWITVFYYGLGIIPLLIVYFMNKKEVVYVR